MSPTFPLYLSVIDSEVWPNEGHSEVKHGDLILSFPSRFSHFRIRTLGCWHSPLLLSDLCTALCSTFTHAHTFERIQRVTVPMSSFYVQYSICALLSSREYHRKIQHSFFLESGRYESFRDWPFRDRHPQAHRPGLHLAVSSHSLTMNPEAGVELADLVKEWLRIDQVCEYRYSY